MSENRKILGRDDNQDMRNILGMRLEVNGYEVIESRGGEEALEKFKEESPALLILDLMMPKISGFEVCRMVKFDKRNEDIPIIVLSALDQQSDREKAISAGADAYFIKPFDLDLLLAKIGSLIDKI